MSENNSSIEQRFNLTIYKKSLADSGDNNTSVKFKR